MRIDVLIALINKYASAETISTTPPHPTILVLKEFLATKQNSLAEVVTWNEFKEYAIKTKQFDCVLQLLAKHDISLTSARDILKNFHDSAVSIFALPDELLIADLARFLDPVSTIKFFCTAKTFYSKSSSSALWIKHCNELGIDKNLLNKVVQTGVIKNYKNLYKTLGRIKQHRPLLRLINEPWKLLCLSSEIAAFDEAAKNVDLKEISVQYGCNALHYVALSDNPTLIDKAIALELDPKQTDEYGRNAMHYAAWSGNLTQIDKVTALKLDLNQTDKYGRNAIHYAALSGNPAQIDRVLLELDLNQTNQTGFTLLHFAAWSGNPAQIDKVIELCPGINPQNLNKYGSSILHFAAWSGNPKQFDKVFNLELDPMLTDKNGWNSLHYAALSGNPAQIDRVMAFNFDLKQTTNNRMNILHLAARSGNSAQVVKAIALGLELNQVDENGHDAMWHAQGNQQVIAAIETARQQVALNTESENTIPKATR